MKRAPWQVPLASAAAIAAFATLAPLGDVVGLTGLAVAIAFVATIALRFPDVRAPLFAAFAVRAGAALLHAYVVQLPGAGLDAVTFESLGWAWSQADWHELTRSARSGAMLYSWLIAVLYWFTTRSPLLIQGVNVLLGTLTVFQVYALASLLWGRDDARRAAWLAALFPTMILYSAITLREMLVAYPLTLGAVWLAKWRVTDHPKWVVGAMAMFVVGLAFHTMMVGAIVFVIVSMMWRSLDNLYRAPRRSSLAVVAGLIAAGSLGLYVLRIGVGAGGYEYADVLSSTDLITSQQLGTGDRASYLRGLEMRSLFDAVWQIPLRTVFFLFMPFPWVVRAAIDLVGLFDALFYVLLCCAVFGARRLIWRSPLARSAALLWSTCAVVFALVVTNYGTAIRHRGKLAPLLIAVAIPGLWRRATSRDADRAVTPDPPGAGGG